MLIEAVSYENEQYPEDNVPFADSKSNESRNEYNQKNSGNHRKKRREFENPLEDIFDFF